MMKRKFAILGLTAAACLGLALGLAACTDNNADNTGGGENGGGTTDDPVPVHVHRVSADSDGVCDDCHETLYEGSMGFTLSDNLKYYIANVSDCIGAVTVPDAYKGLGDEEYLPVLTLRLEVMFGCNELEALHIPAKIESIEKGSGVVGKEALTEVTVASENTHYYVEGNALFDADDELLLVWNIGETFTLPDKVDTIKTGMFSGDDTLVDLVIPSSVKTIERESFSYCGNLRSVTFAEGSALKALEMLTFGFCQNLTTVRLAEGLETIGDSAFSSCPLLTEVELPDSLKEIGMGTFNNCSALSKLDIPDGLQVIGARAFLDSGIRELYLPASLQTVGADIVGAEMPQSIVCHVPFAQGEIPDGWDSDWAGNSIVIYSDRGE